jgi:hypothetical protein
METLRAWTRPYSPECPRKWRCRDNIANLAQLVALLGNVEHGIFESLRHGGGVPYSAYGRFHEPLAEDSAQLYGATLVRKARRQGQGRSRPVG